MHSDLRRNYCVMEKVYDCGIAGHGRISVRTAARGRTGKTDSHKKKVIYNFRIYVKELCQCITGHYLLLLLDTDGLVLDCQAIASSCGGICDGIPVGSFFTESSLGTSAVAMSMRSKREVSFLPQHHYVEYLQNYHEYCIPMTDGAVEQGYLVLLSEKQSISNEMMAVMKLLMQLVSSSFGECCSGPKSCEEDGKELSQKQASILKLVARGLTDYAIAREMKINIGTVKYHKQNIFKKYNVGSSVEAVVMAVKHKHLTINEL